MLQPFKGHHGVFNRFIPRFLKKLHVFIGGWVEGVGVANEMAVPSRSEEQQAHSPPSVEKGARQDFLF